MLFFIAYFQKKNACLLFVIKPIVMVNSTNCIKSVRDYAIFINLLYFCINSNVKSETSI